MATIALPQGASKALSTPKGKAFAGLGVGAVLVLAYLVLGGGDTTGTTPASTRTGVTPTTVTATTVPATAPTTPYQPSTRNPFTKGDGTQPATE